MSLLALSVEVREEIYRQLLCPPKGIRLECMSYERSERKWQELYGGARGKGAESDLSEDYEEEVWYNKPVAAVPVQTPILYVNRQISGEAFPVLFRHNRFTFDVSPKAALLFLKKVYSYTQRPIKEIGFAHNSTSADDGDCKKGWDRLITFIGQEVRIENITIQVPQDLSHKAYKENMKERAPDGEWFWWPAVHSLLGLLLKGKILSLRLRYCETYVKRLDDEDSDGEESDGDKNPSATDQELQRGDGFYAIGILQRECERRPGQGFVAKLEEYPDGEVGSVLVLTRTPGTNK